MTEKVVSLSGGLVLGMAFALLLGVTASQNGSSSMNVDYPSISSLIGNNDFQSYRTSSPAPQASDTTPVINVSPPPPRENTGRIVRIATASETTHPVTASPVTTATEEIALKGHETIETPKDTDNLRQINLQNTYTARSSETSHHAATGFIASQSGNFTAIANGSSQGGQGGSTGGQPPVADNKPQITGSPSIAQNNPQGGEQGQEEDEDEPAIAGYNPRPPDSMTENGNRAHTNPVRPEPRVNFHETEEGHQGGGGATENQPRRRPEFG